MCSLIGVYNFDTIKNKLLEAENCTDIIRWSLRTIIYLDRRVNHIRDTLEVTEEQIKLEIQALDQLKESFKLLDIRHRGTTIPFEIKTLPQIIANLQKAVTQLRDIREELIVQKEVDISYPIICNKLQDCYYKLRYQLMILEITQQECQLIKIVPRRRRKTSKFN